MLLENIGENFEGPSWSNRIFFYFCLFSFLLIIFLLVFIGFASINPDFAIPNGPNYNTTELRNMGFFDNERYLISALVQSLAATIALVITLSLVAVQLAAQSYSARVIDVYKNNPDMWILLSIYIVVIFYGLGLLKVIDIGAAGINMEFAIFAAYFLGFFAFVCLIPYMVKTLDLLKPSTVIKLLAAEITKEKVLLVVKDDSRIIEKDPIQPILDIINIALERNDDETARNGLLGIKESTDNIMENYYSEKGIKNYLELVTEHIKNIGMRVAKKDNENLTILSITTLGYIGMKAAEKHDVLKSSLSTVSKIGIKSIEQKLEWGAFEAIDTLRWMGIGAAELELENETKIAAHELEEMGAKAIECKLNWIVWEATFGLRDVGNKSAEKGLRVATQKTKESLQKIVDRYDSNDKADLAQSIDEMLHKIEELNKKQNWTDN